METFSITYKTTSLFSKPITEIIQAKHIREAMQKLREKNNNVLILSFMQQ